MKTGTADKYSRISGLYDIFEWPMEKLLLRKLRREAVSLASGRTLEVGVGSGKNLEHYPSDLELHAMDFSPGMLRKAYSKAHELGLQELELREMDVEDLDYSDNRFDTVVSTFVFCTVPDPVAGLREVRRVLAPGGRAVFLEHMKSSNPVLNIFLHVASVFTSALLGTSMVRETLHNIERAGFGIVSVENRFFDIVRLIVAKKDPD